MKIIHKTEFDGMNIEVVETQQTIFLQFDGGLKQSSYKEVARWLTDYTGRKITSMGLWKRIKKDRANRRRDGQRKRYTTSYEAESSVEA